MRQNHVKIAEAVEAAAVMVVEAEAAEVAAAVMAVVAMAETETAGS
jgi:hypothetical protein